MLIYFLFLWVFLLSEGVLSLWTVLTLGVSVPLCKLLLPLLLQLLAVHDLPALHTQEASHCHLVQTEDKQRTQNRGTLDY